MGYEIYLYYKNELLMDQFMEGHTTIQDLIDFLIEVFPQLFKEQDRPRILIKSRSQKNYLNPNHHLQQILGQQQDDIFDIEINQESQIIGNKQKQDNNQNQFVFDQQNKIEQLDESIQKQIELQFIYKGKSVNCELDDDTTLEYTFIFIKEHLNIIEQVYFIWNEVNLSELPQQRMLKDLKIGHQNKINIISASQIQDTQIILKEQKGELIKIQFSIEDGIIKRSCVINCGSEQILEELKNQVLSYIGITDPQIAYIELFYGSKAIAGLKLKKTIRELNLINIQQPIIAKVRWWGG